MLRRAEGAAPLWSAVAVMVASVHKISERASASLALRAPFGYMEQPVGLVAVHGLMPAALLLAGRAAPPQGSPSRQEGGVLQRV